MAVERINHYKSTAKLSFCDESTEQKYNEFQLKRGRSTGVFSLAVLTFLCLTFAFLEERILGINSPIPMYAYMTLAGISLLGCIYSISSSNDNLLTLRIVLPGFAVLAVVLATVFFQGYRIYHTIEIVLLVLWLGSLNVLSFKLSSLLSLLSLSVFFAIAFQFGGASELMVWGMLPSILAVLVLASYLSYMMERSRRMLFLTNEALSSVYNRQESWAFTLIDMDMALSGICNFNELIARLMEQIKTTIDYDAYILTSLQGKGPKPVPDVMEGTLFSQEDQTLWPDDLLTKLSQTRQATTSAEYKYSKGFMGREKKEFLHFRLDMPVMNESTLMGVISLRRKSGAFDDLDMTASVSITTQAMMIFNRSRKESHTSRLTADLAASKSVSERVTEPSQQTARSAPVAETMSPAPATSHKTAAAPVFKEELDKESSTASSDLDVTMDSFTSTSIPGTQKNGARQGRDETVVPKSMVDQIKQNEASVRKTITLLSRENADQIALDRYRTAAVEGEPLSLLLVEVDGLSSVREKEGDQVAYKIFAGIVKYVFSKTDKDKDVLGRYGQNGFSILLPRVDMNAAERFAESVRVYSESARFKTPYGERQATLSIGVAAITDETGNHEAMVKRADMALFVAKKNGRNCVKVRL